MTDQTKQEIKDEVVESLLDAIIAANVKKSYSVSNILLTILQVAVVPLIGWLLLTSVEIQKDIVLMRYQLQEVNTHLKEHIDAVDSARMSSSTLHHAENLPNCVICHTVKNNPRKKK